MTNTELREEAQNYIEENNITSNTYEIEKAFIDGAKLLRDKEKTDVYTSLANAYDIVGKKVRVVKSDRLDDNSNIDEKLRWHIGDEFKVAKIECLPYGVFLYRNKEHNLNYKRAKLVK